MSLTITERATRLIPAVAEEFGLSVEELTSERRLHRFTVARQAACYGLRQLGMSIPEIGEILKRDTSTVQYSIRKVNQDSIAKSRIERLLK